MFVSEKQDISALLHEHPEDEKYKELCRQYSSIRRVRGDGNCFYRALGFSCLETLRREDCSSKWKETLLRTPEVLLSAGFNEASFRKAYQSFLSVLEHCENVDEGTFLQLFNEEITAEGVVQYLRLLTSAYMQKHADFFQNFVEASSLKVYCCQEVEIMATECDHVEILALSDALSMAVNIVSLEGGDKSPVHHTIPAGAEASVHLLYKNCHYDIIYPPQGAQRDCSSSQVLLT